MTKVDNLINKLNDLLHQTGNFPDSPAQTGSGNLSPELKLTPDMSFESLSKGKLILAHTLLHKFYPVGIQDLNKRGIEQLHKKVKEKIEHLDFDSLDRQNG